MIPLTMPRLWKHSWMLVILVLVVGVLAGTRAKAQGNNLIDAANRGDLPRVRALLASGANVNAKDILWGRTPLHFAALQGHEDVVELLLTNKADVNAKDGGGETPLHWAAFYGHKDVVELLLANKAEVNAKDNIGQTPLHYAVGHKDVVELLLANKAEVNAKDNIGQTPLHYAVGNRDVVELLLDNKADVNTKSNNGQTPLSGAVAGGHSDVAELLRQHGGLDASTQGQQKAGEFNGSVLHATPKSPEDTTPAFQTSDLVKQGISPLSGNTQFTSPNGIVYSTVELDRVTGKIYLTSPDDKLQKVEVSGFDTGRVIFTLVTRTPPPVNSAAQLANLTITHANGSVYVAGSIGYAGESTKVTVVTVTLENNGDQNIRLNWREKSPVLRTTRKRLEATLVIMPNWLPMAGGAGSTEMSCGGEEIRGFLEIDKDTSCGWLTIDKPGGQIGDHVSIPLNSAMVTVTKGTPATFELLFPGDITLPDAELVLPECKPSPFRVGLRMSPKISR